MTDALFIAPATGRAAAHRTISPKTARFALAVLAAAGLSVGILYTSPEATAVAVSASGDDLVRLLRFMALLKSTMAMVAFGAVFWRLGGTIPAAWLLAYGAACGAMAAGPGLIWDMGHVGLGAALLHGGLFANLLLLWRDPAVGARLSALLKARAMARHLT